MEQNLETVKVILEVAGEVKTFWLMMGNKQQQEEFENKLNQFVKQSNLYSKFEE